MSPPGALLLSRKSLTSRPLQEWLPEVAADSVLVTTGDALAGAPPPTGFRAVLAVADYFSWTVEHGAQAAGREHGVGAVASSSEDDVLRAARLRSRLGLPGQSEPSALAYRDKVVMKRLARDRGVGVPDFAPVDRPADLLDFVAGHGLPVVLKPRLGAGGVDVHMLHTPAALAGWLAAGHLPAAPARTGVWLVEAYVDAPLFHVDGVTRGGEVLHCWPGRYSSGNAEAVAADIPLAGMLLAPDDPDTARLQELTRQVHRALPAPPVPTSFHLEAWLPRTGPPLLCEVACRTGGGNIADAYEAAFGVTLSKESLRGQCGMPPSLDRQPERPGAAWSWVTLAPGHGRFVPPPAPCPVPGARVQLRLRPGDTAAGAEFAGHGAAFALVSAACAADSWVAAQEIVAWWRDGCRWE